jgi:uracil-DNA glycosylase
MVLVLEEELLDELAQHDRQVTLSRPRFGTGGFGVAALDHADTVLEELGMSDGGECVPEAVLSVHTANVQQGGTAPSSAARASYGPAVKPLIYCADIGSVPRGRFGWARMDPDESQVETHSGGTEMVEFVEPVGEDIAAGRPLALGFECPLFVPVPEEPLRLGMARPGENNRAWSGGAGAGALATGLVEVAWTLRELSQRRPDTRFHLDWVEFAQAGEGVFLWEAFVTERAKTATYVDDAAVAVAAFRDALPDPTSANAVTAERPLSVLGAALLWSGPTEEIDVLRAPCLVIKGNPAALAAVDAAPDPALEPRAHRDRREVERKLSLLDESHVAPLTEFVRRLRAVHGPDSVPWFDPTEAGTEAPILLLFENPGRRAHAAQGSGLISADNDDRSAENTWHIFREAGIDRRHAIVAWNIVPWYLGDDRTIGTVKAADLDEARPALVELLGLLPRLRVVVLLGRNAERGWDRAAPKASATVLRAPHTSDRSLNQHRGVRTEIIETLVEAKRIAGLTGFSSVDV